jgi:DNA-binding MarR family transcriptional regulator
VTVVAASDAAAGLPQALTALNAILLGRIGQDAIEVLSAALAPLGLRVRHFVVMTTLAESGPSSQHTLGQRLRIDRTTMVSTVDDLERLGLATRVAHPDDRRAYLVELTARGRTSLVRATGAVTAADGALLALLSPAERGQLHRLLARLVPSDGAEAPAPGRRKAARRPASDSQPLAN